MAVKHRLSMRGRIAVVAVALTGLAVGVPPFAPLAVAGASAAAPVSWTPCRDGFQCATVPVPLDYDRPAGAKIALSLIRLPAGSPAAADRFAVHQPRRARRLRRRLRPRRSPSSCRWSCGRRFDIVGFDPRGIIRSTPLRCFDTFDQAVVGAAAVRLPGDRRARRTCSGRPTGALAARVRPARRRRSSRTCPPRTWPGTWTCLRQALGDRKLNYLGFSYGSFLGQTYANLFPDPGPRPGDRRRARPDRLDDRPRRRGPDHAVQHPTAQRPGRPADARRVLPALRRGRRRTARSPATPGSGSPPSRGSCAQHPIEVQRPVPGGTFTFTYADLIAVTLGRAVRARPLARLRRLPRRRRGAGRRRGRGRARWPRCAPGSVSRRGPGAVPELHRGLPRSGLLGHRQPGLLRGVAACRGRLRAAGTATSAGRGPGPPASACPGRTARARTATSARGPRGRPRRCWSSATTSTRPPGTRARSPPPGCCPTRGCCPTPAGATPRSSSGNFCVDNARHPLPGHHPDAAGRHRLPARGITVRAHRGDGTRSGWCGRARPLTSAGGAPRGQRRMSPAPAGPCRHTVRARPPHRPLVGTRLSIARTCLTVTASRAWPPRRGVRGQARYASTLGGS